MADIRFYRGISTNLNNIEVSDGQLLFAIDTGDWFIDVFNSNNELVRRGSNINEISNILEKHLSSHAPSNAEANVIVGVKLNGADVTVDSERKVNIEVPDTSNMVVVSNVKPEHECLWCNVLRETENN